MKKDILVIIKKELARFFGDKRMVFTTVIMPGLMIYFMYSVMGQGFAKSLTTPEDYVSKVYVQNMPQELSDAFMSLPIDWEEIADADREEAIQEIADAKADGMVVFPEHFMEDTVSYDVSSGTAAPNVEIYYNSAETNSITFYDRMKQVLNSFEESIANKLDINAGDKKYDCASENGFMEKMLAMLLPMLIMTFIFSGCISSAPESIAGEKERGTIATLLVTPMKRSSLALGKIISLSIIALLSGISSFAGTILSLPKMLDVETDMNISYGVSEYITLFFTIFSTVLLMVSAIAVLSAAAKSVKEAGTMTAPLMLVNVIVSLIPMLGNIKNVPLVKFLIPIYNSVLLMNGVFASNYELAQLAVTVAVNLLITGIFAFVLTRMFGSEKIMFAK